MKHIKFIINILLWLKMNMQTYFKVYVKRIWMESETLIRIVLGVKEFSQNDYQRTDHFVLIYTIYKFTCSLFKFTCATTTINFC